MFKYCLVLFAIALGISDSAIPTDAILAADVFRFENRVFLTGEAESTKLAITIQRISFRKEITSKCKTLTFKTNSVPDLIEIEGVTITGKSLPVKEFRSCSNKNPKSDSYRSGNQYVIHDPDFVVGKAYLIRIIKPKKKSVKTNRCGFASFKLAETLTPFSSSYEINIYSVKGREVKNLPFRAKPTCLRKKKGE